MKEKKATGDMDMRSDFRKSMQVITIALIACFITAVFSGCMHGRPGALPGTTDGKTTGAVGETSGPGETGESVSTDIPETVGSSGIAESSAPAETSGQISGISAEDTVLTAEITDDVPVSPESSGEDVCSHVNTAVADYREAGCLTTGYSGDVVCADCGELIQKGNETPAKGHTPVTDGAKAPSCTSDGKTEGEHCSTCGEILRAQETIPALGHDYAEKTVAPTYTSEGYTLHTCSRCKKSYKDNFVEKLVDPNAVQGSGTKADPYRIATAAQLDSLRDYISKKGLFFRQIADIDVGEFASWEPIGTESKPFRNNYDGGGFVITGLSVTGKDGSDSCLGLFGAISEATFSNVKVTGASVANCSNSCGILAGRAILSTIDGCSVSGTVSGNTEWGGHNIGGLVGYVEGSALKNCISNGTVSNGASNVGVLAGMVKEYHNEKKNTDTLPSVSGCASAGSVSGNDNVGGLIGCDMCADVTRSSSGASVTASGGHAGGLIGLLDDAGDEVAAPSVSYCFATGSVSTTGTGYGAAFVGGLIGHGTFDNVIHDCYSTGNIVCSGSWSDCQDNWMSSVWLRYRNPAGALIGCMESTFHEKNGSERYALTVYNCYATGSVTFKKSPWVSDTGIANGSLIGCVYDKHTYYNCKSGSAEGKQDIFFGRTENNYCVSTSREYYLAITRYGRTLPEGESTSHTVVTNITAADLKSKSTFAGFDFSKTWKMGDSGPALRDCAAV
ncbi:MAG: hypothetical protein IJU75_01975 [Clostridia bacterium]|nr:hypothetical protein [Clostridia bacterium]